MDSARDSRVASVVNVSQQQQVRVPRGRHLRDAFWSHSSRELDGVRLLEELKQAAEVPERSLEVACRLTRRATPQLFATTVKGMR